LLKEKKKNNNSSSSNNNNNNNIGVARGVQWAHLHPQGGEKIFRRNLQGKFVSAPPGHEVHLQAEQESIFRTFFAGLVRFGGLSSSFRPSFEGDD